MDKLCTLFNDIEKKYLNSEVYSRNLLFDLTKDEFVIEFNEDDEYYDLGFYKVGVFVDYKFYDSVSSFFGTFLTNTVNKKVKFFYKLFIDIGLLNYFVENTILYEDNKEWCIIENRLSLDKKDIVINKNIKFMIDLSNYNNKFIFRFKKIDWKVDKKYLLSLCNLNLESLKLDMNCFLSFTTSSGSSLNVVSEDLYTVDIKELDKYVKFVYDNREDLSYEILFQYQFFINSYNCKNYNEWKSMFNQRYLEKFNALNLSTVLKSCYSYIIFKIDFSFEFNKEEYQTLLNEFQTILECFDSNFSSIYVNIVTNSGEVNYYYKNKYLDKLN